VPRIGTIIRDVYRRPGTEAVPAQLHSAGPRNAAGVMRGYAGHQRLTDPELERLEGVLWIRPLWLAAWRCWLAVVSPKVNRAFVPDAGRLAELAGAVRASVS